MEIPAKKMLHKVKGTLNTIGKFYLSGATIN